MSITFVGNKYDPLTTHSQQLLRLGTVARDEFGRQWSYVQINETLEAGDVVRDSTNYDARAATRNTTTDHNAPNSTLIVATGVAVGDTTLEISQTPTVTPTALWLGGVGAVVSDNTASNVTAIGQQFIVTGINSATNIQVEWLTNRLAPLTATRGVVFAGTGTLEVSLIIPGQVYRGPLEAQHLADPGSPGSRAFIRGIIQNAVTVVPGSEPYGWVLQKGIGWAKYLGEDGTSQSMYNPLAIAGAVAYVGQKGSVSGVFKHDVDDNASSIPNINMTSNLTTQTTIRAALRYVANQQPVGRLMTDNPEAFASQATNLIPLYVSVDNESTNMQPVRATHPLNSVDIV